MENVYLEIKFNKITTKKCYSRWQMDKEALWSIENPTNLSSDIYVDFIFNIVIVLAPVAPTQSANNLFCLFTVLTVRKKTLLYVIYYGPWLR